MSNSSSTEKLDIVYRLRFAYTEDDLDEAADEIERLRGLVVLREKQLDTHINAIFKKDSEIERLRKLLRDGLTSNIPEWRERVREVLGE